MISRSFGPPKTQQRRFFLIWGAVAGFAGVSGLFVGVLRLIVGRKNRKKKDQFKSHALNQQYMSFSSFSQFCEKHIEISEKRVKDENYLQIHGE